MWRISWQLGEKWVFQMRTRPRSTTLDPVKSVGEVDVVGEDEEEEGGEVAGKDLPFLTLGTCK